MFYEEKTKFHTRSTEQVIKMYRMRGPGLTALTVPAHMMCKDDIKASGSG